MSKIILSINAGSSSVKISIYSASQGQEPQELAETQIDGLTAPPPKLKYLRGSKTITKDQKLDSKISSQKDAFEYMLDQLIADKGIGSLCSHFLIQIVWETDHTS